MAKYVKRGVIRVATDTSMTVVLSNTNSQFYNALVALLEDVAAGIIANDPTIIAAAEEAVDGVLSSPAYARISDLGVQVSSTATYTDLNTLPATSGWFRALSTALNRPDGSGAFSVLHLAYSATNATQIATSVSGTGEPATYVRVKRSDVWSAWAKLTTPGDRSAIVSATGGRWIDLNSVDATQPTMLEVYSTALNRPVEGFRLTGWHIPSDTSASQLLVSSSTPPHMWTRAKTAGAWSDWQQIIDASILDDRVTALPTELDLLTGPQHRSPKEGNTAAFRVRDSAGMVSFEVRPDGTTFIANAAIANGAGGGGGGTPVSRVHMIVILGQSNAVGKGEPVLPMLEGVSSRIWQLPDGGASLVPATAPLSMPGGTATGLAPGHALARELAEKDPNCVVVIVPAAKGGSGLVTDPALGYGKWAVGYNGPNPHLHSNAVSATQTALALIATQWGLTPSVTTHWAQGEADGADGITRSAYAAELDTLITDWLGRFGGVFVISGMVPQVLGTGTRAQIELALQDTPRRLEKVAYVPGIDNGGGAGGPTDVIHFGMEAILALGLELYKAIRRAANNVAASHTYPPLEVEAKKWGSEVTVEFTPSSCRVTAYEVQSSTDGSTWNPVTMAEPLATRVPFTSAAPVKVRVRAIGTETSNWTAPVPAIGG